VLQRVNVNDKTGWCENVRACVCPHVHLCAHMRACVRAWTACVRAGVCLYERACVCACTVCVGRLLSRLSVCLLVSVL